MEANTLICTENLCRTCMMESSNLRSLFHNNDVQDRSLGDILAFVTNMDIKLEDRLPKHICVDCESLVNQSDKFKRRCMDIEAKFRKLLKSEPNDPVIKTENGVSISISKADKGLLLDIINSKENLESSMFGIDTKQNNSDFIKEEMGDSNSYTDNDYLMTNNFHSELLKPADVIEQYINKIKNDNEFVCPFCNMVFHEITEHENHIRVDHCSVKNVLKLLKNKKRKATDKTKSKKNKLDKKPERKKIFSCEICNLELKNSELYRKHMRQEHTTKNTEETVKKYECSHCMRKFVKKTTLANHLKRHMTPTASHICSLCKREFMHRAHLDNHILSIHTTQDGLKCDICSKSFATEDSLELHKEVHSTNKKHKCKVCSKAFNMLSTLRDHLRVHTGEKPFLCPTCGKGFSQNTNLQEHLRRHQGIKPFKCEMCDRRFVSKGELSAHTRKHSGAHPFVCTDCGGAFTTSSSLVKHRRTHTGERPYQCDMCDMRFAASGTLKNHRRTHTGEKPYKCSHCDKAFVQKNDLVAHTRCHTGERPYVCATCGQAFRQGSALKTHLKMHNVKEMPVLNARKDLLGLVMPSLSHSNGV